MAVLTHSFMKPLEKKEHHIDVLTYLFIINDKIDWLKVPIEDLLYKFISKDNEDAIKFLVKHKYYPTVTDIEMVLLYCRKRNYCYEYAINFFTSINNSYFFDNLTYLVKNMQLWKAYRTMLENMLYIINYISASRIYLLVKLTQLPYELIYYIDDYINFKSLIVKALN